MHQPSITKTHRFTKGHEHNPIAARIPSRLTPLVMATTAALLGLAAGQAQAIKCATVSTAVSTTQITESCLIVTAGGAIDVLTANGVSVSTSVEFPVATSVNNAGRITGNTSAVYVTDNIATHTTTVTNTGTIAGTSQSVNRASSLHAVTVYNESGAQLVGGLNASSLLNYNGGSVTIKSNVTLSDIRNTGGVATAVLSGSYTGESGSTLRVAIAGPTSYSYLSANTTNQQGGTLEVDVKANSGIASGNEFYVIRGTTSHSGTFSEITDNSAMFNFTQATSSLDPSITGLGIYIKAVRALTAEQASRNSGNFPGVGAAQVLDSGASGLSSVVSALGALSTEKAVSNAVSQTLPLLTGGSMMAARSALGDINGVVQSRIENNQGLASGDPFLGDKHVWLKPFGSWADQGDQNGVTGYKATTTGFVLGVDGSRSDNLRVGGAFAYAKSNINGNSATAPQSNAVSVYQLIGYGSYGLDERTEVNFQGDIGVNRNNGQRYIALTSATAASSYDSLSMHIGGGVARAYPLSEKSTMTGGLRADYTRIRDSGYTETGAGALNLNVQSRTTEAFVIGIDGKLAHSLNSQTKLTTNLGLGYDLLNEQASITAAFAGSPSAAFTTNGLKPSPWLLRAGVGVVHNTASGVEISARYDAEYRENFLNQTASVKARWMF
ncbi:autotransporter outer membrane beta-barrel domain-containing protein [Rhodoferax sp. PAMC 29310]|uniref:autotransporter family protein n=1 Tax=Rhodoferax sp. PAMC 29310 TaxID=2822760 RepID=UPI001B31E9F9|nr:autotransporter outer membrane beta-barrel domain-containing protein [Rhodoferax sp. PAMC 29310]